MTAKSKPLKAMLSAGLLATALLAAAAPALAAEKSAGPKAPPAARTCFFLSDWDGWKAPDDNTLYLKVRLRDVYRVDLAHGTSQLTSPGVHLVSIVRGSSQVCAPIDLDLRVSDSMGFATPIMARSITKLTPEEIAAIPKKDRP
jgi:hypothetical protein